MSETALIFGAGKTGRGFAAHLAYLGGYKIVLVDKSPDLVSLLTEAGEYQIEVIDSGDKSATIHLSATYHISDRQWYDRFTNASIVFTSVFGNNLDELAQQMAPALIERYNRNPDQLLTVITCENLTGAAGLLRSRIIESLSEQELEWLDRHIGFSESIIFRTCLSPAETQDALTVRAQNFFELPCDADGIKGNLHVYGLKPARNFTHQLRRKIYTYNCINAVISYLGAKKNYTQLYEAGNDRDILQIAMKAAEESARAQIAEFGFDPVEQREWTTAAFAKFADRSIPDPIDRNATDPVRKLGRDDRLIGPALLALKHGIAPSGLLEGIIAAFEYCEPGTSSNIIELIKSQGTKSVLANVCQLYPGEPLFELIRQRILQQYGQSAA